MTDPKKILEICDRIQKHAKEMSEAGTRLHKLFEKRIEAEEYLEPADENSTKFDRKEVKNPDLHPVFQDILNNVFQDMNTPKGPKLECPYCGKELSEDRNFCCGEAGHGVTPEICKHNQPKEDCEECHLEKGGE